MLLVVVVNSVLILALTPIGAAMLRAGVPTPLASTSVVPDPAR